MASPPIAKVGLSCVRSFESLITLLQQEVALRVFHNQLPIRAVEDELGRLRVWAGNIGAFQPATKPSSLEYRLREASHVKRQIIRLLEDLCHSLEDCVAIVAGERPSRESFAKEGGDLGEEFSDISDSTDSELSEESNFLTSELEQLHLAISEAITSLYKLSISIRKPTPRDRYAKAAALVPLNPIYDIGHVYEKCPQMRASPWLFEKLGRANTKRREILRYREKHHEKLARGTKQIEYDDADQAPRLTPQSDVNIRKPSPNPVPTAEQGESVGFSQLASTKATTFIARPEQELELEIETGRSETSYVTSIADDSTEGRRQVPEAPSESAGGKPFECPYCYTIQSVRHAKHWSQQQADGSAVVPADQYYKHVGQHLEQLALFVLSPPIRETSGASSNRAALSIPNDESEREVHALSSNSSTTSLEGTSPSELYLAVTNNDVERTKKVLEHSPNSLDNATRYPEHGCILQVAVAFEAFDVLPVLLEYGADVNVHSGIHDNVLQAIAAAPSPILESLELVLNHGADVNRYGGKYGVALIAALEREPLPGTASDYLDAIKLLLDRGADPNLASEDYAFPLFSAIRKDDLQVLRVLLDKGADPTQKYSLATSSIDYAKEMGSSQDLVNLLLNRGPIWAPSDKTDPVGSWRSKNQDQAMSGEHSSFQSEQESAAVSDGPYLSEEAEERTDDAVLPQKQIPLGLQVVYEPTTTPIADIIFVHGLVEGSQDTWSKDQKSRLFWPKWLSYEPIIDGARVFTFSHNAVVAASENQHASNVFINSTVIDDVAKDLLYSIRCRLDDSTAGSASRPEKVPKIFVAHSLGGNVVKRACLLAQQDPKYHYLVDLLPAMVFFAVPHSSSYIEGHVAEEIMGIGLPGQTLTVNHDFRVFAATHPLKFYSFVETKPTYLKRARTNIQTTVSRVLLDRDSSVMALPNEVIIERVDNHFEICKFASRVDPGFAIVRNILKDILSQLSGPTEVLKDPQIKRQKLRRILSLQDKYEPVMDMMFFYNKRVSPTCEGFSRLRSIQTWLTPEVSSEPSILWLRGPPGCGKSVMSAYIASLPSREGWGASVFFSFQSQNLAAPTWKTMLRSVAFQIATSAPAFDEVAIARTIADPTGIVVGSPTLFVNTYMELLQELCDNKPTYLVIDAADECDLSIALTTIVQSIARSELPIRLLLVSRYSTYLLEAFAEKNLLGVISMQDYEASVADIAYYVDFHFGNVMQASESDREFAKDTILRRAHGNFLWVSLIMRGIANCRTMAELEQALDETPAEMTLFYERIELEIEELVSPGGRDLLYRVLMWLVCARCDLSLTELSEALEVDLIRYTELLLGSQLVTIEDSRVTLFLPTVRDYLLHSSPHFSVLLGGSHSHLFFRLTKVMMGLSLNSFEQAENLPITQIEEPSALSHYAAANWSYHLQKALQSGNIDPAERQRIYRRLEQYLEGPHLLYWIYVLSYDAQFEVMIQTAHIILGLIGDPGFEKLINESDRIIVTFDTLKALANELMKVPARFGRKLLQNPEYAYSLPLDCPSSSAIYQRYIKYAGLPNVDGGLNWSDLVATIQLDNDSPGRLIAAIGRYLCIVLHNGTICIYNSVSLQEVKRMRHDDRVSLIAYSTEKRMLVAIGERATKAFLIPEGVEQFDEILSPRRHGLARDVIVQEGGSRVLVAFEDTSVWYLELSEPFQWRLLMDQKPSADPLGYQGTLAIAIHKDGSRLAVASRNKPLAIFKDNVLETRSKEPSSRLTKDIKWHPKDEDIIVGVLSDHSMFVWNIQDDFADKTSLRITGIRAQPFEISPNGKFVAVAESGTQVALIHRNLGMSIDLPETEVLESGGQTINLCISPDSCRIYQLTQKCCRILEPELPSLFLDGDWADLD
ncbi:uncharacterized protein KY384_006664 [Bacidia gigantensis]|uniref:uncharacterized protein n=1 Tax=Bacidia gigantensis TaxID=2732470 RepID=UPI001D04047A|nr:uncharacterized protein KY384_006664 [Bacidia gigantensis]KAG8528975.1 hypothetical protein KY384_006664 [Bacidia gigantensis]